jgi:hypothetical protein
MSYHHLIDAETVLVIQREMKSLQEALMYTPCTVKEYETSISLEVTCGETNVALLIQCRPLGERDATGPVLWYKLVHEIEGIFLYASHWWKIPEIIDRICAKAKLNRSLELCVMDANDTYHERFSDQTRVWIHPMLFSHVDPIPKEDVGYLWLLRRVNGIKPKKDTSKTFTNPTPPQPIKSSENDSDERLSFPTPQAKSCSKETKSIAIDITLRKSFENRVLRDGLRWIHSDLPMNAESKKSFHPNCGHCSRIPDAFVYRVYEWKWKDIKFARTWMCVRCFDNLDEPSRIQFAYRVFRYHVNSNLVTLDDASP